MRPVRNRKLASRLIRIAASLAAAILSPSTIAQPQTPTWASDIAPILYKNCATCHHPGGAGPFSLLTYAEARRHAPEIAKATVSRYMPPWLPEPNHGDFADVRRLSDAEIAKLHQWLEAGTPAGDLKQAPATPHFDNTWQLGKPDLILKAPQPFTLAAGGTDVFRNFVFPYPLKEGHYIRAMEIRPTGGETAPEVVHHANILIDRTASFRRQHSGWQSGIPGMEILLDAGNTFDPDSHFLFWKPDTPALIEPEGMPWRLDPGNDLILNMHLKPSGRQETIAAEIGLYFTGQPPTKQPMLLQLDRDDALDIPAGNSHFTVEDSLTLPVDVEALGVYPHAHYLGKEMQAWATLPSGEKKWLVWIRDWDIDRQSVYRYRQPLELPKGTVLHMRYVYDNSAANPRNPHNPPIRVRNGNRSEDEMAHLWLQVLPVHTKPNAPDPRLQLEEAWMRSRLNKTPNDRISLYNLGAALSGQHRYQEAVEVFQQSLKLDPNNAGTLTALGAAQDGEGNWQSARDSFQQAIAIPSAQPAQLCDARYDLASLDLHHDNPTAAQQEFRTHLASCPNDASAHLALAEIALDSGQTDEAIHELTEAVETNPSSEELHAQLASAYAQSGDLTHAEAELRKAESLSPNDPQVNTALAQLLGAAGQLDPAIAEQKQSLQLQPNDPDGWNNLGVLEARIHHPDEARKAFEHALQLQPDHVQAKANLARLNASH